MRGPRSRRKTETPVDISMQKSWNDLVSVLLVLKAAPLECRLEAQISRSSLRLQVAIDDVGASSLEKLVCINICFFCSASQVN